MFKLKYTFIMMLLGALFMASCSEGDNFVSSIENGTNLASFTESSMAVANIANGSEYKVEVPMKIEGPSVNDLSGDITVTLETDFSEIPDALRAEAGTHFRLDNNQLTLKKSENYADTLRFTMLTQGITPPLDDSPQFNLKATDVSGGGNVIVSNKTVGITLNYACPSNLDQITYSVQTKYTAVDGSVSNHNWTETWTKTGVGTYRTERVGHWEPSTLGGTPGMTLSDVCKKITVPSQNLVDTYSNIVKGTGSVDESTGVVSLDYSICAGGDCRQYEATYTPEP